uniref:PH domain-containing protein n=1 Tax=Macrostomum lignano TaxID=282301 RepID=A0A1I8G9U5_9PLAT
SLHSHQTGGGDHDPNELLDNEDLDSDLSSDGERLPVVQGTLSKWTNYITGWQSRFFVLKDGTLSYFKSPEESAFGCRGAISLSRALVTPHTLDENRFDVCVGEHIWYLRCDSRDLRTTWIRALESHRTCQESGIGSESSLKRHNSLLSLTSGTQSIASQGSFRRGHGVKEKLAEIDTFREMLIRQVDTLQGYFDLCSQLAASSPAAAVKAGSIDIEDDVVVNGAARGDSSGLKTAEDEVSNNADDGDDEEDEYEDPAATTITAATMTASQSAGSGGGTSLFSFFSRRSAAPSASPAATAAAATAPPPAKSLVDYDSYMRLLRQHGGHAVDFKGEANTFRATTAGIIHQMSSCLELMTQREEQWKKRLDREMERRRKVEDVVRQLRQKLELAEKRGGDPMGPDFEEGPCCQLDEEEFFDAIDAQLDKMDMDASNMSRLRQARLPNHSLDPNHPLTDEIMRVCQSHWDNWGASCAGMELLEKDGKLAVYRKQLEEEGE